jgi:pimeloyl-ACP methyl ester carboxylesterase
MELDCYKLNESDLENHKVGHNEVKQTKVNGHTVSYSESKDRDRKHVLFIHGIGASLFGWRDIPDALSDHFHTISVDLIGFGGSDKPENADYTIKGFSKFIMDFLGAIKLRGEKLTAIIGHSLGGYIALQVAIDNKDLVEKLVLIDSSGLLEKPTPLLWQYLDAAMEPDPILRYKKVQRAFEELLADRSRLLPIVVDTFIGTIGQQGAKHAFVSAFDNSTNTQIEPGDLEKIENIPCLILWGEKDNLIPIKYLHMFRKTLKNAEYETIVDSGHAPFVEKTATVYESIRTFLTYGKRNR